MSGGGIPNTKMLHSLPDWFLPELSSLQRAVVATLVYADIFDYPLRPQEVHRYLLSVSVSMDTLQDCLLNGAGHAPIWSHVDGYVTLPGREALVATRRRRAQLGREMWSKAVYYGRLIARLPFVRMVGITGALAMDNADAGADIDYLIVTEAGRLWSSRAWTIALVRLAARRGVLICPNYFISERALVFPDQNLFSAHELAQLIPLKGWDVYRRIRQVNAWTGHYLPNAGGAPCPIPGAEPQRLFISSLAEKAMSTPAGGRFERWEMDRKIRKFSSASGPGAEAAFSTDCCKGHFDQHGQRIRLALERRLQKYAEAFS